MKPIIMLLVCVLLCGLITVAAVPVLTMVLITVENYRDE